MIRALYAVFGAMTVLSFLGVVAAITCGILWRRARPRLSRWLRWYGLAIGLPITAAQGWMIADILDAYAEDAARAERIATRRAILDTLHDALEGAPDALIAYGESQYAARWIVAQSPPPTRREWFGIGD